MKLIDSSAGSASAAACSIALTRQAWSKAQADAALARYTVHRQRRTAPVPDTTPTAAAPDADARKRSIVEAALARARSAKR